MEPATEAQPEQPDATASVEAAVDAVRESMRAASAVAMAAFELLLAEFHLARSSVVSLLLMVLMLVFLGTGAWLALSAAVAAGISQLSGSIFVGIGSVALLNLFGVGWILILMRRRLLYLSFPQTRQLIAASDILPIAPVEENP